MPIDPLRPHVCRPRSPARRIRTPMTMTALASRRSPSRHSPPSRLAAVVVTFFLTAVVAMLGVWAADPAAAHDALVSSDPANGATVVTAPDRVTLTLDEPALAIGTTLRVIGPGGDVQSGGPHLVNSTVTQELAPGIPAGGYRIAWRVTSVDGHPVSGELSFTASAANPRAPSPSASSSSSSSSTTPAAIAVTPTSGGSTTWVRVIGVVVLVLLAGGGALWLSRRLSRRGAATR